MQFYNNTNRYKTAPQGANSKYQPYAQHLARVPHFINCALTLIICSQLMLHFYFAVL